MDLESLALIGEFVGGTAVLITIIYLAYQSRQNRMLLEQATGQQAASMRQRYSGTGGNVRKYVSQFSFVRSFIVSNSPLTSRSSKAAETGCRCASY
jgi:hypothetical protein